MVVEASSCAGIRIATLYRIWSAATVTERVAKLNLTLPSECLHKRWASSSGPINALARLHSIGTLMHGLQNGTRLAFTEEERAEIRALYLARIMRGAREMKQQADCVFDSNYAFERHATAGGTISHLCLLVQ